MFENRRYLARNPLRMRNPVLAREFEISAAKRRTDRRGKLPNFRSFAQRETAEIHKGDAVPVLLNEAHSFKNNSSQNLEFMLIGIASQRGVLETVLGGMGNDDE
jgi:hypothetical protein